MGKGIDLARPHAPIHAAVLDDFKDQLVIVLLKRLADKDGNVSIPLAEMDDTYEDLVAFSVRERVFHFEVRRKS